MVKDVNKNLFDVEDTYTDELQRLIRSKHALVE